MASQGGALALMARRPSGAAIDGVGALEDDDGAGAGGGGAGAGGFGQVGEVGEEAGELAVVGGEDDRGRAGLDGCEERGGVFGADGEGVGVEDEGGGCGEGRGDERALGCAGAEGGAEQCGGEAGVGEPCREILGAVDAGEHDGGQVRGVDQKGGGGARERHEAGAGAKCRARGEAGGAGARHGAGDDEGVAAAKLVILGRRRAVRVRPEGGTVLEGLRRDCGEDGVGDADLHECQAAAEGAAGVEEVRWLLAEEGDGGGGADRGAERQAGVGMQPRGEVHGEDGGGAGVHRRDEIGGGAGDPAVEAGAEEGVDDEGGGRQRQAGGRGRTGPAVKGGGGVAAESGGVAEEGDADIAAGGHEAAGGDEAVAAVVAGTGEDEDGPGGGEGGGGVGHGATGGFHQGHPRGARGDGGAVGLAHLGGGEDLVHVSGLRAGRRGPAECAGTRRCCRGRRCRRDGRRG